MEGKGEEKLYELSWVVEKMEGGGYVDVDGRKEGSSKTRAALLPSFSLRSSFKPPCRSKELLISTPFPQSGPRVSLLSSFLTLKIELTSSRPPDRRKLCQQVVQEFGVDAELAKVLVPDGILTAKVTTHLDLPGVSLLQLLSEFLMRKS